MRLGFSDSYRFPVCLVLLSLFVLQPVAFAQKPARKAPGLTEDQKIRHVLSRLTYGARPGDVERVKKIGIKAFIDQQLNAEFIDDTEMDKRVANLPALALPAPVLAELYNPPRPVATPTPVPSPSPTPIASPSPSPVVGEAMPATDQIASPTPTPTPTPAPEVKPSATPAPRPTAMPRNPNMLVNDLQRAKLLRAVYSERQLYEVMVDFWENHFSIFINKDANRWLMAGFDRELARPFTLGRFRDLLGATARSPAMLYYLDNWQSSVLKVYPATKDSPERQTGGINENYARELMELHTLGVGGGYTQKDVQEVARCFTGWTIRKPNQEGTFMYNPAIHDNGEKIVLGQKIPAGGGIRDAEVVLDILAKHPSTAKYIATKLATRFIGDDPPKAAIDQAARVFLKTDGSIRETLRSLITSPSFFNKALYKSKLRSPFEFTAAALRITGAKTDGNTPIINWIARMGQPIFGHRTPEGFPERSDTWLSNNALLTRINFISALVTGQLRGTTPDMKLLFESIDHQDPVAIARQISAVLLMNEVSPVTRDTLAKAADAATANMKMESASASLVPAVGTPKRLPPPAPVYINELLILALGAPEFQRK